MGLGIGLSLGLASCSKPAKHDTTADQQAPPSQHGGSTGSAGVPAGLRTPDIRVALAKGAGSVDLRCPAAVRVLEGDRVLLSAGPGSALAVARDGTGLSVNGRRATGHAVMIESLSPDTYLQWNGQEVAPRMQVFASGGGLTAVALLDVESYLTGVLAGEVPYKSWHAEALKAQAVASRSYALYQMKQHTRDAYDVESTVMSQVFKPGHRHDPILRKAVQATYGQIVTYHGRMFATYFHSTSGGHTEPAQSVFGGEAAIEPLGGVDSPYSNISPASTWTASFSKEDLRRALAASPEAKGQSVGTVRAVSFLKSSASPRRATEARVQHSGGVLSLPATRFRMIVGATQFKSVWIDRVDDRGDSLVFSGRGFGHGVGMCQYGSQGMAQKGFGYMQILGFYYPGGDLTKLYTDTAQHR